MRRLEEEGVIRSYTIREKGIGLTALVRMKVGAGVEIGSLAGEFANWKGVESVYEISGEADLVAIVHVDDTSSLRELLDRMWLAAPAEIASPIGALINAPDFSHAFHIAGTPGRITLPVTFKSALRRFSGNGLPHISSGIPYSRSGKTRLENP